MVWKKDLAKLKQDLKTEEALAPPKPAPIKRAPKPEGPLDIECEDAMFLAAMGKRPARLVPEVQAEPLPETLQPKPVAELPVKEESFQDVMSSLKGVKRMRPELPVPEGKVSAPAVSPQPAKPDPVPTPVSQQNVAFEPEPEVEAPEHPRSGPVQIQLAAGMAIDVDGTLDLRGHSPLDAMERLKERILDGQVLGWRTLHATLGSSELGAAFQEFLKSPDASVIARYAQAPIPMGGPHAWILYIASITLSGKENS
jgi:hypothetical protein